MKRTLGRLFGMLIVIAGAAGCEQPSADCTTGHGGFAAKYTLIGSQQGAGTCGGLKGEKIGLEKFNPSKADDKLSQDLTKSRLRIRTSGIGNVAIAAEAASVSLDGQDLSSLGDFVSTTPDENNVCSVPTLSPAAILIPAGAAVPEADMGYTWKNVRIFVTTAYPGTQMVADLTYREGSCTADYSVVALWPAIECSTDVDCDPFADPANGRDIGSGINPDFKPNITCDADISLCVLKEPPAALR